MNALAVFGGKGDVGEVGGTVPAWTASEPMSCCADPTGDCQLIKVAFDFDAHYVVAGCVDLAPDLQGADLRLA